MWDIRFKNVFLVIYYNSSLAMILLMKGIQEYSY